MTPARAPDYMGGGDRDAWCTITDAQGVTWCFAAPGALVLRRVQDKLVAWGERRGMHDPVDLTYGPALHARPSVQVTLSGRWDARTAEGLAEWVSVTDPDLAESLRAEARAKSVGPISMLCALWLAYAQDFSSQRARSAITPWGSPAFQSTYTPFRFDAAPARSALGESAKVWKWDVRDPIPQPFRPQNFARLEEEYQRHMAEVRAFERRDEQTTLMLMVALGALVVWAKVGG